MRRAEHLLDPRLQLFAAVSLLRLGDRPDSATMLAVASDAETRGDLFKALASIGHRALFPTTESTQEKLAESDMVRWLTYSTELGRAPEHIELMKTVERDLGPTRGILVYYVFRFKTDPPHWAAKDGWLAGISGPFRKEDFPRAIASKVPLFVENRASEFMRLSSSGPANQGVSVHGVLRRAA